MRCGARTRPPGPQPHIRAFPPPLRSPPHPGPRAASVRPVRPSFIPRRRARADHARPSPTACLHPDRAAGRHRHHRGRSPCSCLAVQAAREATRRSAMRQQPQAARPGGDELPRPAGRLPHGLAAGYELRPVADGQAARTVFILALLPQVGAGHPLQLAERLSFPTQGTTAFGVTNPGSDADDRDDLDRQLVHLPERRPAEAAVGGLLNNAGVLPPKTSYAGNAGVTNLISFCSSSNGVSCTGWITSSGPFGVDESIKIADCARRDEQHRALRRVLAVQERPRLGGQLLDGRRRFGSLSSATASAGRRRIALDDRQAERDDARAAAGGGRLVELTGSTSSSSRPGQWGFRSFHAGGCLEHGLRRRFGPGSSRIR